jgi:peptide/nickel transport system ATP-binding protein
MTAPALAISGLSIRDGGGAIVVDGIDLTVEAGGMLVLIGETGSGKSLIAQAVMGLLPQGFTASGTIAVGGQAPVEAGQAGLLRLLWARETMLLPQEPRAALDPTMRIGRQLFPAGGGSDAASALAAVGLAPDIARSHPAMLSGGMAQRVLVASVLVGRAPLLIADEPTKGLDPERLDQTRELLLGLRQAGRALVVITHDIALARALGGRLCVLREGRVVEQGDSAAIFGAPGEDYTRAWIEADPARWRQSLRCCCSDASLLSGHGLAFGWRGRPALFEGLDLHLPRGGVLAITGRSGCGKTTLGNILLGLQPPGSGTVGWGGVDPYRDLPARRRLRRRYQKLHQDPASVFLPRRPIGRQLADLAEIAPDLDLARELPPLLERLRLDRRLLARLPGEISGGEAQRLALARILLLKPDVVVADEPTSRLDPLVQRETMALLREIVATRALGLVLIGHDRALLAATADEIVSLDRPSRAA